MKLTKEDCLRTLENIDNVDSYKAYTEALGIIEQLIDEHFELLEKYNKLERKNLGLKQTIKNLKEKEDKRYQSISGGKYE